MSTIVKSRTRILGLFYDIIRTIFHLQALLAILYGPIPPLFAHFSNIEAAATSVHLPTGLLYT